MFVSARRCTPSAPKKITCLCSWELVVRKQALAQGQPWDLEHRSGSRLEQDKEEDVGSSGGDEDVADDRWETLKKEQDTLHAEIAQGALQRVLDELKLDTEGKEMEKARSAKRKQKQKRKRAQESAEEVKKRRRSFLRLADSEDEDGLDEAPAPPEP